VLPADIFPKTVGSLFQRLRTDRIRHLFLALIRVLIKNEIDDSVEKGTQLAMFDVPTSRTCRLVSQLVEHGHFERFHTNLFDITKKDSLATLFWEWTKQMYEKALKDSDGPPQFFFVFKDDVLRKFKVEREGPAAKALEVSALKVELTHHVKVMENWFGFEEIKLGEEGAKVAEVDNNDEENKPQFATWLNKLKPWLNEEILWLLGRAKDEYEDKLGAHKDEEDLGDMETTASEPAVRLLMGMLGHLLENCRRLMSEKLKYEFEEKVKEQMVQRADEKSSRRIKFPDFNLCMQNLSQLGAFLTHSAQAERIGASPSKMLIDFVKKMFHGQIDNIMGDEEDKCETALTGDLYKSHFDVEEYSVAMDTKHLLNLSNALWVFKDKVILLEKKHLPEDKLYQLLSEIQPAPADEVDAKAAGKKASKKTLGGDAHRVWMKDILHIAEKTNVMHNMIIMHRFMEFHKDLCFCRDCQAPIPRSMAPQKQRGGTDRRLIKIYKRTPFVKKGMWEADKECDKAVEILEKILKKKAGQELPPIRAKEFLSLRYELEEMQKNLSEKISKDAVGMSPEEKQKKFQIISEIEKGKKALDVLRSEGVAEKEAIEYLNAECEGRQEQKVYLDDVEKGLGDIRKAQVEYDLKISAQVDFMKNVVNASEEVILPEVFKLRASDQGCTLKFVQVERAKRKEGQSEEYADLQKGVKMYPSATYSLLFLRAKKVIAWVQEGLPKAQYKNVNFTFECLESGGWEVRVTHEEKRKARGLFTFQITSQEIQQFTRAGKSAKKKYNDGWVVINAFNLLQLLARITAAAS